MQDGPLGFPAGLVIGFYPKPVEVVSLRKRRYAPPPAHSVFCLSL